MRYYDEERLSLNTLGFHIKLVKLEPRLDVLKFYDF